MSLNRGQAPILFLALLCAGCAANAPAGLEQIDTVVVIYAENRSFDHLYGLFPGAEGVAQATAEAKTQVDHDGTPLPSLPGATDPNLKPRPDLKTQGLPNGPFRIDQPPVSRTLGERLPNPIHAYYQNREQINGGKNNRFIAATNVGSWVMGYFDGSQMKVWKWAQEYTLADHFFMGAFGGSYLNHHWLICACTPHDPGFQSLSPEEKAKLLPRLDERGFLVRKETRSAMDGPSHLWDSRYDADGYTVNTTQPPYQPSGLGPAAGYPELADTAGHPLPASRDRTIGDTLSAKGVSWAWYAGGWNAAVEDGRKPLKERSVIYAIRPGAIAFQPHHQPFNYYARFAPGTADRKEHLKDYDDLVKDIERGTLPHVSFYKPVGRLNEHPGYTEITPGDEHIAQLLSKLKSSPQWARMAVIVTYDENGGFWDHVPPPAGDRWGPGSRIPTIIVSPLAKRGYVDKTVYDTTSILKFITRRFELEPLPGVRQNVGDLTNAFQLQ